ncbi:HTH-type transcriptional regulator RutR [Falsiruegeria litorea R37]|uniref:HTH-type transcriptional regulator RutR n=1 Tax=Falsiruegeria litorea R37 TaxID=1200284 RepID=A0A1Y5S2D7_9RHOB|nr:TetR/AcrR family transcriptional regulator [Falsiruegeria litorea]SLN31127.1 HTH-type transcriptional regulator RutR [Falsiruegeria litorea R37]
MSTKPDPAERYLDLATTRFSELGFHGVSLALVAKDAGVTKQAVLHYFRSKERLYAEVLNRLAVRLLAEIDATAAPTPAQRLIAYFSAYATGAVANPEDARLVVRALLDSDAQARSWPLKPYLDTLTDLALQTPRWQSASREEALAGLYQLIGAIQYFAISAPTLSGMYGKTSFDEVQGALTDDFRKLIQGFAIP